MKKQKLSKVKSVALDYAILIALVVMSIYYTMDARGFPTLENLTNILNQNSVYIILAVGQTLVILTAGIDLSVGSVLALSAVISADVAKHMDGSSYAMIPVAGLVAVGVGGAVGAFNGAMVTVFKIPPFIATLAMMTMARGIANIYCNARPIGHLPAEFKLIGTATVGTVPLPVFIMAAIAAALFVITRYTVFGRYVYAVGGNEEAARLSGIDVAMTKFWVYVISGMCAGLCGLILAARLGSGDPKLGLMYELVSIAAVVLGGTSLFGGRGSVIGTIYGALFIGVLENGLLLKGVSTFYQWVIKGIVILIAVIIDELKRR
ncbi:MAG: ABC transporter permease [Planctomycetota bacterium]|jgi:ribose/xylose/arabinose/galactoside ABC-type transport system permease subunit